MLCTLESTEERLLGWRKGCFGLKTLDFVVSTFEVGDFEQRSCSAVPLVSYIESENKSYQNSSWILVQVQKTPERNRCQEKVPKTNLTIELARMFSEINLHYSASWSLPSSFCSFSLTKKGIRWSCSRARAVNPSLSNTALPSFVTRDGRIRGWRCRRILWMYELPLSVRYCLQWEEWGNEIIRFLGWEGRKWRQSRERQTSFDLRGFSVFETALISLKAIEMSLCCVDLVHNFRMLDKNSIS